MEMTYAQRGIASLLIVGPILLIVIGLALFIKAGCPSPKMRGDARPRPPRSGRSAGRSWLPFLLTRHCAEAIAPNDSA